MRSAVVLRRIWLALAVLVCQHSPGLDAAERDREPKADVIGRRMEPFALQDFRGKSCSLSEYADKQAIVVCFLGTECPLAKLYGPRLQKLADQFAERGVAFIGISSNSQDSITELAAYARVHGLTFPILKDLGQKVADQFGATRTPEVFVLDREQKIRYSGRVDGQFTFGTGVGLAQPQAQRADLEAALVELISGKEVSVPITEVKGCLIGHDRQAVGDSPITYAKQISRLFQERCLECHREGQIAPFALGDYESAKGWGEMIAEVVREERMPPWHANPQFGHFANENRLSAEQKELVRTWVENGCPEGNPADLPQPRKFNDNWFLPRQPDQIVYMTKEPANVKAEGVEPYRQFVVDPGFTEDKWVKIAECMPGNRAVVHHIIVYLKPPGQRAVKLDSGERDPRGLIFLAGFAPGTRPLFSPAGWAKKIPAGSQFVFEMHYTPIGTPQTDRSSIGLIFLDEKDVTHQMATANAPNNQFVIPPHDANYRVDSRRKFDRDVTLLSLFPHMHMRGKSFRYELTLPGSEAKEILLDVPHYDFNWQNSFILAEPRMIPAGSVMYCTAYFDNSDENPANPDPSKSVRWGPQTWEEMMIGWFDIGIPIQAMAQTSEQANEKQ